MLLATCFCVCALHILLFLFALCHVTGPLLALCLAACLAKPDGKSPVTCQVKIQFSAHQGRYTIVEGIARPNKLKIGNNMACFVKSKGNST